MEEAIRKAIKKIAGNSQTTVVAVATVKSVDWDKRTCVVTFDNGMEFEDVRLRAIADDAKEGVCLKPKVDSRVTVAEVDRRDTMLEVIGYTEVDAIEVLMQDIELTIEDGKVKLKAKEIIINDGDNKGVPILDKVKANFDAIKKYLDIEKQAISAGIKAVGVAMQASGTIGATTFDGAMASNTITFENMENTKVKH